MNIIKESKENKKRVKGIDLKSPLAVLSFLIYWYFFKIGNRLRRFLKKKFVVFFEFKSRH